MVRNPNHPWINSSEAPLYVLTYPSFDPSDAEQVKRNMDGNVRLYYELERWTKDVTIPYVFVVDLTNVHSLATNRQRAAEYLEKIKKRGNPNLAGRAFVTPNKEVKGVMTAVFWISPPDYPHEFFSDMASAKTWAWARLAEAQLKNKNR